MLYSVDSGNEQIMKAAVYYDVNQLKVQEMKIPEIGPKDVLLKVKACGICASDFRSVMVKKSHYVKTPRILGHEISAEVAEVGKDVGFLDEGMKVTIAPGVGCHKCDFCRIGKDNLCENRLVVGANMDGGFAEYLKIPESYLEAVFPVPDFLSSDEAALTEPLSTCLHGVLRAGIKIGDSVAIIGSGPIGLLHLQLAKSMGASQVIVCDMIDHRLSIAKGLGAETINVNTENMLDGVLRLTNGKKVDKVIVAVGSADAIAQSFNIVKPLGSVVIFGGLPSGTLVEIDPNIIHYSEITVTGSSDSTLSEFKTALSLIARRIVDVKPLISHHIRLENILEGFSIMSKREAIKILVTF